ncbi:restriction endonuclease subunit S [Eubacteriaceae bacterium ES3]|nr:restriction endonuclease subunit S [Eubacteriaceae bacterium ES3]
MKLNDIASINSGLVVRRKQAEQEEEIVKEYQMLTLKSFDSGGWLNKDELELFVSAEDLDKKYLTRAGDIIIRLSSPNTAITISEDDEGYLVPSLFAIVRVESDLFHQEYLGIYLNSQYIKKVYARSAVGSTIQIIKTSMLRELEIPMQEVEKQRQIIKVSKLIMREKHLLQLLVEEKNRYHDAIMKNLF